MTKAKKAKQAKEVGMAKRGRPRKAAQVEPHIALQVFSMFREDPYVDPRELRTFVLSALGANVGRLLNGGQSASAPAAEVPAQTPVAPPVDVPVMDLPTS